MTYIPKELRINKTVETTVYVKEKSKAVKWFIISQLVLDGLLIAYLLLR